MDKRPENATNDQNFADPAAEKVKQKELKVIVRTKENRIKTMYR